MRRHLSYANIMSAITIVFALTGSSYAATLVVTSQHIKDGAITSAKVKDQSIAFGKLSSTAKSSMRGYKGLTGPRGPQGAVGPQGFVGPQGDAGESGMAWTSWANVDTGLLTSKAGATPNSPAANWDNDWDAAGGPDNISTGGHQDVNMNGVSQMVVALAGMNTGDSGGTVTTDDTSNLSATANLTFLHRNHGEGAMNTGGDVLHGRLECQLSFGNGQVFNSFADMGTPQWVSSDQTHEIVHFTIVGNAKNVAAGNYNVAASCKDGDLTGSTQWSFVSGNLAVLAARQ